MDRAILIFIHFGSNTGYAIAPLERAFFAMAKAITCNTDRIHFAYKDLAKGHPDQLPDDFSNIVALDPRNGNPSSREAIYNYIKAHGINVVFGFDFPVLLPTYATFYAAGVRSIISYWGAPMSARNSGLILSLKRLQVFFSRHKPDHFIFESLAMQNLAVHGRGIPLKDTSIVYLGVDTEKFKPCPNGINGYAYTSFGIPIERKIIFYSGHMEARKGVKIIIQAALLIIEKFHRKDVHFLFLGNRPGEEKQFESLYRNSMTQEYITFGGYRHDIENVLPSSYIGTIASTGWDSFTMSSLEMAACGIPLIVSELQGLRETIVDGKTGFLFQPGDFNALARSIVQLLDNKDRRNGMSQEARKFVLENFTVSKQIENLTAVVNNVIDKKKND